MNLFGFDPPSVRSFVRDYGITTATYYNHKDLVNLASEHSPLASNISDASAHSQRDIWQGVSAETCPGCGGALGRGGYDHSLLRLMEILGYIRVCKTTAPEKCLDSFKGTRRLALHIIAFQTCMIYVLLCFKLVCFTCEVFCDHIDDDVGC